MFEILSSALKYVFILLVYLFIYWIARLIYLDIRTTYRGRPRRQQQGQPYLKLVNRRDELDFPAADAYPLGTVTTVGRSAGNDIVLPDSYLSAKHALFRADGQQFAVEDLASTNGTFVNGTRLAQAAALKNGDRITLGRLTFLFVSGQE